MGLFRKNKTKKKTEEQKKEDIENISVNLVDVKIYRIIGKDLYSLASEFQATEKTDNNTNRITINEEKHFKEDTNFSKARIYETLYSNLELESLTYKEKVLLLTNKIDTQKKFLKTFDTDKEVTRIELNSKYNFEDEEVKLDQLRVLKDSLKYSKLGSYMRLGARGVRTYEFVSNDGVLYPFVFGGKFPRAHPDLTVKKKIFNQENTIFKFQTGLDKHKNIFLWMAIVFILICGLWSLGNGFWTYKVMIANRDIEFRINEPSLSINNAMATMTNTYGIVIEDYLELRRDEIEILKKNENTINSKSNNNVISPNNK